MIKTLLDPTARFSASGGEGDDVFLSCFGFSTYEGDAGEDTFHYYLGDGLMKVHSGSHVFGEVIAGEVDSLIIHAEGYALTKNNLFLGENPLDDTAMLDIVIDGSSKGQVELADWGDEDLIYFTQKDYISYGDLKNYLKTEGSEGNQKFIPYASDKFFSENIEVAYGLLSGKNPFFLSYVNTYFEGGSGSDTFYYQLGDEQMTVYSKDDNNVDTLYISSDSDTPIKKENLFWNNEESTLDILIDRVSKGKIKLQAWDDNHIISFNRSSKINYRGPKNYFETEYASTRDSSYQTSISNASSRSIHLSIRSSKDGYPFW